MFRIIRWFCINRRFQRRQFVVAGHPVSHHTGPGAGAFRHFLVGHVHQPGDDVLRLVRHFGHITGEPS